MMLLISQSLNPSPKNHKIAILLLAAGGSSRMGVAKQLLPWGGTSMIGNAINQAKSSVAGEVLVVLGANFDDIEKEMAHSNVSIIRNKEWEMGLGSSIACGIDYIKQQHPEINTVLVMLADQPLIDSKYLNVLIESHIKGKKGIVATRYGSKYGVPAIFSKFYFGVLGTLRSDHGAKELINSKPEDLIGISIEKNTMDIDTMQDYKQLSKLYLFGSDNTK